MGTTDKAAEDDTGPTEEVPVVVTGDRDVEKGGLTDQARDEMKRNLEDLGYKAKDAVTT
jgi:hypothetical protein